VTVDPVIPVRILFVEDETNLRNSLSFILEREGFEVMCAATGEEALAAISHPRPDLILLDINLPGIDGFEVCNRLRRQPATAAIPIMLLSARTAVEDLVAGLERYADDYVTKPFQPRVLVARINALLRRRAGESTENVELRFRELVIHPNAREALVGGKRVVLTKSEFDLLLLLARSPQRAFTRDEIIDVLRGESIAVTDRVVDFQVAGLRRKLGSAASLIETVRGIGYRFSD
jgi:two-component system alkaline phosphatase synthesis response regulator PhoP